MDANEIVIAECRRQAKFGYEPSWEDFVIAGMEEAKKQRDIQWVKYLMHEKHYMSDIPPADYEEEK